MWRGNLIHLSWIVEMHLTLVPPGNVDKSVRLGITLDGINFTWRRAGVWLMCRSGSLSSALWLGASELRFFCHSSMLRVIQTSNYAVCVCPSLLSAPILLLFLPDLAGHQQDPPV